MSAGIDYGMGLTNIDMNTGIRFGVIPMNALGEFAHESFEGIYPQACPKCGSDVVEHDEEKHGEFKHFQETTWRKRRGCDDMACESCELALDSEDVCAEEPNGHECTDSEYKAHQFRDDGDIFIEHSPFYTLARFCSPCAPGACYLLNADEGGAKAYCFGHDWFAGDRAPYPVYRVSDDELVRADGDMRPVSEMFEDRDAS